jgi:site-specific DNA-methyltransferase (adenine-specific)
MATLIHGDCLSKMKALPDKSIDLFVCDLPYGCLEPQRTRSAEYVKKVKNVSVGQSSCAWDIKIDLTQFWAQVKRLCKDDHTPVIMFCSTKFGVELINSNPDWFRYDLVWNKMRGVSFLQANKMPMRCHELIYVFSKKGANYYRKDIDGTRCVISVVEVANKKGKGKHPTQKPDDLYAWLIERYSKEGDTILDPTAGSFASVFTAAKMGRKAIGIEMDDAFFAKAIKQVS